MLYTLYYNSNIMCFHLCVPKCYVCCSDRKIDNNNKSKIFNRIGLFWKDFENIETVVYFIHLSTLNNNKKNILRFR